MPLPWQMNCGILCITMVRMRMTKGKRNKRRSHYSITPAQFVQEGGVQRLRHRASRITGVYRGRAVLTIKQKASKKTGEANPEKATSEVATLPPAQGAQAVES